MNLHMSIKAVIIASCLKPEGSKNLLTSITSASSLLMFDRRRRSRVRHVQISAVLGPNPRMSGYERVVGISSNYPLAFLWANAGCGQSTGSERDTAQPGLFGNNDGFVRKFSRVLHCPTWSKYNLWFCLCRGTI